MPTLHLKFKSAVEKSPTGIRGLDELTEGGLPRGRPTLICGGPGCGKTVLGMEFLVHGAVEHNEPGVFMAFEETTPELTQNFASMRFDIQSLCARKKLYIEHVRVERNEIEETGEYDLDGLFIRLEQAISSIGAKRLVLDTIECLFAGFLAPNYAAFSAGSRKRARPRSSRQKLAGEDLRGRDWKNTLPIALFFSTTA